MKNNFCFVTRGNDKGCAPFDCFLVELDLINNSNSFFFINRDLEVC